MAQSSVMRAIVRGQFMGEFRESYEAFKGADGNLVAGGVRYGYLLGTGDSNPVAVHTREPLGYSIGLGALLEVPCEVRCIRGFLKVTAAAEPTPYEPAAAKAAAPAGNGSK